MANQAWVPAAPPAGKESISHHIPVLLVGIGLLVLRWISNATREECRRGAQWKDERKAKFEDSVEFRPYRPQLFSHKVILPSAPRYLRGLWHAFLDEQDAFINRKLTLRPFNKQKNDQVDLRRTGEV